jgi:hypothetical protein
MVEHIRDQIFNIRLLHIYPSSITLSNIELPMNRIYEPWDSFHQFVEVHFVFTREDFYLPFKKELARLKNDEFAVDWRDLFLFQDVSLYENQSNKLCSNQESHFYVRFSVRWPKKESKYRHVDYLRQNRLSFQSILILSDDPLCTHVNVILQSVARIRTEEKTSKDLVAFRHGLYPVRLIGGQILPGVSYYGFQHTKLWPAYEPILLRLCMLSEREFLQPLLPYFTGIFFITKICIRWFLMRLKLNMTNPFYCITKC